VTVPKPLAAAGQVTHDPTSRSLLVKPAKAGYAAHLWRMGHRAMLEEGRFGAPSVWARMPPAAGRLAVVNRCRMGGCGSRSTTRFIGSSPPL
jgi:hypothetical protein